MFRNVNIHTSQNIKIYLMCEKHVNILVPVSLLMGCIYLVASIAVYDFFQRSYL